MCHSCGNPVISGDEVRVVEYIHDTIDVGDAKVCAKWNMPSDSANLLWMILTLPTYNPLVQKAGFPS